jgi:hypothetical protein
MANAGGAWDNAKKLIESYGRITADDMVNNAEVRGRRSRPRRPCRGDDPQPRVPSSPVRPEGVLIKLISIKAARATRASSTARARTTTRPRSSGDTVGDPSFKDTSGPSLNILIKLISIVSVVFAGPEEGQRERRRLAEALDPVEHGRLLERRSEQLARGAGDEVQLAAAVDIRVGGDDLLDERRARAGHADDEDQLLGLPALGPGEPGEALGAPDLHRVVDRGVVHVGVEDRPAVAVADLVVPPRGLVVAQLLGHGAQVQVRPRRGRTREFGVGHGALEHLAGLLAPVGGGEQLGVDDQELRAVAPAFVDGAEQGQAFLDLAPHVADVA